MAGLDDVLERLVADPSFRQRLAANPSAALAGYELSEEDRALLASQVTDVAGTGGKVEARASRASMAGLMGALADASAELATIGLPDASPAVGDDADTSMNPDSFNAGVNQAGSVAQGSIYLDSVGGVSDTGHGVGDDVLVDGAGGDDPIPTAPSGSGYNTWEYNLQDTSGRETSGAMNLAGDLASDDIVPPPDPSSSPAPVDSISTDDRPESMGLKHTMITSYSINASGDGAQDPEAPSPTGLTHGDEEQPIDGHSMAQFSELAGVSTASVGADAPTGLTDGADAEQYLPPPPFTDVMVSGVQYTSSDAPTGGDDEVVDILEATGEGEPATDPLASVEAVADADGAEAPPDGADALQWDPGDGNDVAAKGEQIEIESWSPGMPTSSAEPVMITSYSISTGGDEPAEPIAPTEHVSLVFGAIKFDHDAPAIGDLLEPDAGDPEPTGPIADVLYSAGGSTTGGVSGVPGNPGTGVYVSHDGGATWVEGAEPRGDADAAFEAPSSDASGDRHPAEMPEGSLAASPEEGTSPEGGLSLNFERMRVNYDPDQVGGGPTQAPDALGPSADDGESAAHPHYYDLLVSSFQSSGSADGEPARDGIADLVVGAGSHTDGADTAIVDQAEPDGAEPAGAGPNADVHAPTTADPLMATFAEYSVNLASPWNEGYDDFNVKGAEPEVEVVPPSDSPGWAYPIFILPQMDQSSAVVGGGTDAPDDLGETRMSDEGGAGASAAMGGPDTEPAEAGEMAAELYEYPGEYSQRSDGVDESAGQGGGIINDSGTMTLAGSTLIPSDDTVPEDQAIAVDASDAERAGGDPVQPAAGWLPIAGDWNGDDASAMSLAEPAPAATDGWVNVGQTEQFLFGNTDIAEPKIEDIAPAESPDSEPSEAVVGDLNAFEVSDRASAEPHAANAPMVETRTVDTDSQPATAEPAATEEPPAEGPPAAEQAAQEREPVAAVVESPPTDADQPIAGDSHEIVWDLEPGR